MKKLDGFVWENLVGDVHDVVRDQERRAGRALIGQARKVDASDEQLRDVLAAVFTPPRTEGERVRMERSRDRRKR